MKVSQDFYDEIVACMKRFQEYFPPKTKGVPTLQGERPIGDVVLEAEMENVLVQPKELSTSGCTNLMFEWEVADLVPFSIDEALFPNDRYPYKEVRETEQHTEKGTTSHLQIKAGSNAWTADAHLSMDAFDHVQSIYVKFFYFEHIERALFVKHLMNCSISAGSKRYMI